MSPLINSGTAIGSFFMDKHMKMTELGNSALDKGETHTSKTGE